MADIVLAYDHSRDPMVPDQLAYEIAAALSLTVLPIVDIDPSSVTVRHPNLSDANRAAIQQVIDAYVIDPAWERALVASYGALGVRAEKAIDTNIAALALPDPTSSNNTYLGHAAIPSGTLTAAQLSTIVRTLSDQVDSLTRQNNALVAQTRALTRQTTTLIRILLDVTDTTAGTNAAGVKL